MPLEHSMTTDLLFYSFVFIYVGFYFTGRQTDFPRHSHVDT